jgi:hypothetical protein
MARVNLLEHLGRVSDEPKQIAADPEELVSQLLEFVSHGRSAMEQAAYHAGANAM